MECIILGGTFNPPHIGHLFLSEFAARECSCGLVLLVPSHLPAHKSLEGNIQTRDRLRMLGLAVKGNPKLKVDDCEIRRGGVSYSIDTVRYVKEKFGLREKPGLILGDDLVPGFHSWKEWERLIDEAQIIIARRGPEPGIEADFPHTLIENPVLPVSSSYIREQVRLGGAFRYLVTESVYSYINRRNLYAD